VRFEEQNNGLGQISERIIKVKWKLPYLFSFTCFSQQARFGNEGISFGYFYVLRPITCTQECLIDFNFDNFLRFFTVRDVLRCGLALGSSDEIPQGTT